MRGTARGLSTTTITATTKYLARRWEADGRGEEGQSSASDQPPLAEEGEEAEEAEEAEEGAEAIMAGGVMAVMAMVPDDSPA